MLNESDDIRPVDDPKSSQPQDMSADQPVSNRTSEVPDTLLPLSPVIESVNEEDCGTDEGQFADALEEITLVEEKVEEENSSKRDSKIEDGFEEAKEHLSVSNETVNMEEKERSAPEAAPEENPEQQQARSIDDDEESNKPGPPSGSVLFLLILGLCLAVLLVSLDRTIITTVLLTSGKIWDTRLTYHTTLGDSSYHQRIPFNSGGRMVWVFILSHRLCVTTYIWTDFHSLRR